MADRAKAKMTVTRSICIRRPPMSGGEGPRETTKRSGGVPVTRRSLVQPTDVSNPDYFHKVVDCQWACPAHTPVPEYIRLIADRRYTDAFMVNWESNVFPGILGRTCDRPCEPACRRGRVEKEPVAICRLKRVAADYKDDILGGRRPRLAHRGAGPRALRLSLRDHRSGSAGGRHDPHANPALPPARDRHRR